MSEALFWGFISSFSLVIGAAIASLIKIKQRALGLIMAFGSGVLLSAVAYELIEEAFRTVSDSKVIAIGLLIGALTFFAGNVLIDRWGGGTRKRSDGSQSEGSGTAIFLGTVLDGVPESVVIGLTLLHGGSVSAAMVVAVFLSNLPEAISATSGLLISGWKKSTVFLMWGAVVVVSSLAALAGYTLFKDISPAIQAFMLAFAGGAILTMLADTMMPEAYKDSGKLVGVVTVLGFCLAFTISILE